MDRRPSHGGPVIIAISAVSGSAMSSKKYRRQLPHRQSTKQADCITILTTCPGKIATKRFVKTATGIEKVDYNGGLYFGVLPPYLVHNIYELSAVLRALEGLPNCLVIRGVPRDLANIGTWVRRTSSGIEGNFETPPAGHHWIQIDIDKIAVPPHLSLKADPIAVCEYVAQLLPREFHAASYHWNISSSAGMGDPSKVSMHLWFWLKVPVPDGALKVWAKAANITSGKKLIDYALFHHVQAHYTAAPIFEGVTDPFPTRSGLVEKSNAAVDLIIVEVAPKAEHTGTVQPTNPSAHAGAGFEHRLSLIGDHAEGEGFHLPIIAAAASYVAIHGKAGTVIDDLHKIISQAVQNADASNHDTAYIAHMASREHIVPAIESALKKYGSRPSPRRKARVEKGIKPYFTSEPISVAEAQRQLAAIAALGL